jgi:hypothetical protein
MEAPKIDPNLDNQIKFVQFMIETNNAEILVAIKQSLLELKVIKDKEKEEKV